MSYDNSAEISSARKEPMTAFVLGGGGARGALQVGALRALLEAGLQPDIVVGSSVGAINGAYLAVRGARLDLISGLEDAWHDADAYDLLPSNYLGMAVRALFYRYGADSVYRLRRFLVDHGLDPRLRFRDLNGVPFLCVATDLRTGDVMLYGVDPDHSVLKGVLASTALPPWAHPLSQDDGLLIDGGLLSNLPIEPALAQGASRIIALDLTYPNQPDPEAGGLAPFFIRLKSAMERRHLYLEMQLAAALDVPVYRIRLGVGTSLPIWDFAGVGALFEPGYQITRRYLAEHPDLSAGA
jgi:NTE family protein